MKKFIAFLSFMSITALAFAMEEDEQLRRAIEESQREELERQQEAKDLQRAIEASLEEAKKAQLKSDEALGSRLAREEGAEPIKKEKTEEKETSAFMELPPELQLIIAQNLGNTLQETIKNIVNLAQTNKHLYELLIKTPGQLKDVLEKRYGKEQIVNDFLHSLKNATNLNQVKPFIELGLITPQDIYLLEKADPQLLEMLAYNLTMSREHQIMWAAARKKMGRLEALNTFGQQLGAQPWEVVREIINYLIEKGIINPNGLYSNKSFLESIIDAGWRGEDIAPLIALGLNLDHPNNQQTLKKHPFYKEMILGVFEHPEFFNR